MAWVDYPNQESGITKYELNGGNSVSCIFKSSPTVQYNYEDSTLMTKLQLGVGANTYINQAKSSFTISGVV